MVLNRRPRTAVYWDSGSARPAATLKFNCLDSASSAPGPGRRYRKVPLWIATSGLIALSACSTSQYKKAADKEVYGLIGDAETIVTGTNSPNFTIETRYSDREPKALPPEEVVAERESKGKLKLSLTDALVLAFEQSRRYQTEKESLFLTALSLSDSKYQFRPKFFSNTTVAGNRVSSPSTTTPGQDIDNIDKFGSINVGNGFRQSLAGGAQLSVDIVNNFLRFHTGSPRESATSAISVALTQPLLRNAGRKVFAENLKQAHRNVIYAVRDFKFFEKAFAVEIVQDYFGILNLKDQLRNRYANYLSRVNSRKRAEARAEFVGQPFEADQARQAEFTAKDQYIRIIKSYQDAVDRLKIKLAIPVGFQVEVDDRVLPDLTQAGLIDFDLDQATCYSLAVERQLPILNQIDQFEDAKRKIKVQANQLKADLNLVTGASLNSDREDRATDYTKFDPNELQADIGLQINLPLDRWRERNNYRDFLVRYQLQIRRLGQALDDLQFDIYEGLRALEQARQNYLIQKSALELANRRVEGENLRQDFGVSDVFDYILAQDSQVAAQINVTTALVDYHVARLQLLLTVGVLDVEVDQFWLQSHLPEGNKAAGPSPPETPGQSEDIPVLPPEKILDIAE